MTNSRHDQFVTRICLFSKYGNACYYVGDGDKPFLYHLQNEHRDNPKAVEYAKKLDNEIRNTEILLYGGRPMVKDVV